MFTYQDARGMQDSYSYQKHLYVLRANFFFSANKYKRVENIIGKKKWQIEQKPDR